MTHNYPGRRLTIQTLLSVLLIATAPIQMHAASSYSEPVLLKESKAVFSRPVDVAISPEGGYLLVADHGNNEIKIMQPGTLKILSQFGADHLSGPVRLSFSKDGALRVIDKAHSRVTSYDFKGVFRDGSANVKKLEVDTVKPQPNSPPETATDPDGQTYRISENGDHVIISDKDNNPITRYGSGILESPQALETVGRYFWIVDSGNNRILLLKAPRLNSR